MRCCAQLCASRFCRRHGFFLAPFGAQGERPAPACVRRHTMNVMNHAEVVAQVVVEAVIQGSRMVYRSDQGESVHDFDLHYPDCRVAAVEVTASVDAVDAETHAAISSRRKGGPRVKAEFCRKAWRVRPGTGANINRIRSGVDSYLAAIEAAGIEHFFSASDCQTHSAVDRIYTDLQVSSGDVIDGVVPGYIGIALPIGGGFIGSCLVSDAVEVEASKPDNRHKLSSARASEGHLFVFVDVLNHRVWTPLVDLPPPPEAPELPREVTHVWAVGPARSGDGYVVWRASAACDWYSLGSVRAQLPKPA